ncbi:universal stress protein [Streptomyces sp. NPDC088817]|uniref:universal stress protein n=1 Tax=Streptomyces sp. NPDC088817 TaxID=3365907 RepID=UPI003818E67E
MPRTITVGLDGSPESRAAAEWAAREARSRGLPVRLLQVWEPVPEPIALARLLGADTHQHWTEKVLREAAEELRSRHPGVEVTTGHVTGQPAEALARAARDAELLVLGSRGLGGIRGFLVGSAGLATVASTERPVVLVRAGEQTADEAGADGTAVRPVVLGLDTGSPEEAVLAFAFDAAARRNVPLRVVHGWNPPPYYAYGMALEPAIEREMAKAVAAAVTEALLPWRQKFPGVEVVEQPRYGSPSLLLIEASRDASLVVVGRRVRRSALGARLGPVTHAVLHHAAAPVAVVAHD